MTRVDLHLHSRASTDTASWFLRRAVLPESLTDPNAAYEKAKRRGMDFVTLSDHNTLEGALAIAHHPDVFVSVEATTRFPEDGVPLHVLVWDLTERDWDEIDRLRPNVYEMVSHLESRGLVFALAHPLQRLGAELTVDHIERCLLIFRRWEGRNGARVWEGNEAACRIAASASRDYLEKLAEKHGIAPRGSGPPALVGGSDDHGLLDAGATWTETPGAESVAELLGHLTDGRCRPEGAHGSTLTLAHSVTSLVAKTYADRGAPGVPLPLRGLFGDLISHPVAPLPAGNAPAPAPADAAGLVRRLQSDTGLIRAFRAASLKPEGAERSHLRLHLAASWAHEALTSLAAERAGAGGRPTELPGALGALAGAALLAIPYVAAAAYHADEGRFAAATAESFFGPEPGDREPRVAMLTDTFDQVNGAAGTIRRFAAHVAETGAPDVVVTCGAAAGSRPGVVDVRPLARFGIPGYPDPDWRLGVPSMIEMVELLERRRINVIHAATPGPMGLAGLILAKAMGLDFVATYHTELAKYAMELTGDRLAAELVRGAVGLFYRQAVMVFSPSRSADEALLALGVPADRIRRFTRGVDVAQFAPSFRSARWRRRIGGDMHVLYVGRISHEKGVAALARAFRSMAPSRPGLRLVLVGDGPARRDVARILEGTPHTLTGVLSGPALARAYASADIFCLPSATETFGQAVLESAASGLPAVVLASGGASELVSDGVTGIVVGGSEPAALERALGALADDAALRLSMGTAARAQALAWPTWPQALDALIGAYRELPGPGRDTTWPAAAWEPVG